MRRIIESTLVSLDGVTGDPHLWAMQRFDDDSQKEALEGLWASDAMLMGRRTYEIFAGVWPSRTGAYAERLTVCASMCSLRPCERLIGITRQLSQATSSPRQPTSSSRRAGV